MRYLVLCALTAATVFTTTDAEARHRRRWHYGDNCCVQNASWGGWNGHAYGTYNQASVNYAPMNYGQVQHAQTNYAPVQAAACVPAQPVTHSAGYAPTWNQSGTNVAPPPPQSIEQPANGQLQAPPAPQPVENEN